MAQLYAGAGCAPILFEKGYYPNGELDGEHDCSHARALLIENGAEKIALVSLELPSVRPWELTNELRAMAAEILGTTFENTWIYMTHDLAAPHVPSDPQKRQMHMDAVKSAVTCAAQAAADTLRPADLSYCEGKSYVNSNRDVESVDGWWVGISDEGPSDKTLSVLKISDKNGGIIALLFSYALKSSVLETAVMSDGKRYSSCDISGTACLQIEKELDTVAMFMMSAAGDQVPAEKTNYLALDENGRFKEVNLAEKGYEICERLGGALANDVIDAVRKPSECETDPLLASETKLLVLPGQVPYPKDQPEPPIKYYDYPAAPDETLELYIFVLGKTVLLGLKPEITTPVFDRIKELSPFDHTMIATLVNGGQGYVAADIDYERFTYPALHSSFVKGSDARFIDFTIDSLKELKEKIRSAGILNKN